MLRSQVRSIVATVDSTAPIIAELVRDNGDSMHIGLGLERTVLGFMSGNGSRPNLISLDSEYEENKGEDATLIFFYGEHDSEFFVKNSIPFSVGLDVFCAFFETGNLSQSIVWEEV